MLWTFVLAVLVVKTSSELSYFETIVPNRTKLAKFYIYELEDSRWWAWPEKECPANSIFKPEYQELSGIGRAIDLQKGLFCTWKHSLFSNFYNRLKRSSRRTFRADEASLFIIPYDLGVDGAVDKDCKRRSLCTRNTHLDLTDTLFDSIHFLRHSGLDHVVIWPYQQNRFIPKGCSAFLKRTCAQCQITTIWKSDANKILPGTDHLTYESIPFPSYIHWVEGMEKAPWMPRETVYKGRPHVVTFLENGPYRKRIKSLCEKSTFPVRIISQAVTATTEEHVRNIASFSESVFCIAFPGEGLNVDQHPDDFIHAILSGCIPVIPHAKHLKKQYPWHLTENLVVAMSVVLKPCSCDNKDLVSDIKALCPESAIAIKQRVIAKVAPLLQYSLPSLKLLENRYDQTLYDPPFLDAADAALDGMARRAQKLTSSGSLSTTKHFATKSSVDHLEEILAPELAELERIMSAQEVARKGCKEKCGDSEESEEL